MSLISGNRRSALDMRCRRGALLSRPRLTVRAQVAAKALTQTSQVGMAHAAASQAGCPFSKLSLGLTQQLESIRGTPGFNKSNRDLTSVAIPGPEPFSLDSFIDVSQIFFHGLHAAMLQFSEKYGPICR